MPLVDTEIDKELLQINHLKFCGHTDDGETTEHFQCSHDVLALLRLRTLGKEFIDNPIEFSKYFEVEAIKLSKLVLFDC